MKAWTRTGIATLATSVGAGLVVVGVGAAYAGNDDHQVYGKRDDHAREWMVVADDDDDGGDDGLRLNGTNTNTRTKAGTRGGTHTRTGRNGGTHTRTGTGHGGHGSGGNSGPGGSHDFTANMADDHSGSGSGSRSNSSGSGG